MYRMNFDQAVAQFARDCYTSAKQDNDYNPVKLRPEWLKSWADDYCNDELQVDDLDGARARFEAAFAAEWTTQYENDMANKAQVIFDNGGGITMQFGAWAHHYHDPKQAATDYATYLADGNTNGWEGHEDAAAELNPEFDEIRNGGYRVCDIGDIEAMLASDEHTGWYNIDQFISALKEAN